MTRTLIAAAAVVAIGSTVLAGCGTANDEAGVKGGGAGSGKTVTMGYVDWDEDVALTYVMKEVLQENGYTVNLQHVSDAGPLYVGLDKGQLDLYLDSWLPQTHKVYWDKYGKNLEYVHPWYTNAKLTIAVPTYMKIDSLDQLNSVSSQVGGKIVGIEPGAGLTKATNGMIKAYGLNLTQQTSSTAAMLAALKKATDAKQPIVVALWRPHWAYSKFPIKDLKDPKQAMGAAEKAVIVGKKGFAKEFPELNTMFKKLNMDDKQLSQMEDVVIVQHEGNPEAGAKAWLKANPNFAKSIGLS